MHELLLILVVLGAVLLLPWIGSWDPEVLLWVITAALVVINLGMTVINLIQAWRQDPRFLNGGLLGLVQMLLGIALLSAFLPTIGNRTESWLVGFPFIAGGGLSVLLYYLRGVKLRKPS